VAVAGTLAGGILQPIDLPFGQIFPGPQDRIRGSARNCPVYDGRGKARLCAWRPTIRSRWSASTPAIDIYALADLEFMGHRWLPLSGAS
jgi:hypothetical protein